MMSLSTHYQTLINRGRKAGLSTRELYSAMSGGHVDGGEQVSGQTDSNGFVAGFDQYGRRLSAARQLPSFLIPLSPISAQPALESHRTRGPVCFR